MRRAAIECSRRLRRSRAWIHARTLILIVVRHPWTHSCLNLLYHGFAWLVGEPFEDERVACSKKRLTVNDSYRDRLLAPEIADLVDLWDAVQLSFPQRKTFFRCFLHLDALRRAGVSRGELLRYCGLRDTPASRVLLPSDGAFAVEASLHRREEFRTQRWDIVQFLSLAFSLCTMEVPTLVGLSLKQIGDSAARQDTEEVSSDREQQMDTTEKPTVDSSRVEPTPVVMTAQDRLTKEIESCLELTYGVPSPVERRLGEFLTRLYLTSQSSADFIKIHEVKGLVDVIALFPVLLFPVVWMQRVIKRRFLGEVTWQMMTTRRQELQLVGLRETFVSAPEIVSAAKTLVQQKQKQRQSRWKWIADVVSLASTARPSGQDEPTAEQKSTPRKVLPDEGTTPPSISQVEPSASPLSWLSDLQNEDEAWKRTADSVLASALGWDQHDDIGTPNHGTDEDAATGFRQTRGKIEARTLPQDDVARIQRLLIREFGYQFATFVLSKSSIRDACGDLVSTPSVKKEERRARQRYQKADVGIALVEDKAIYWKEYKDPLLKQVFYHNVRTGESKWEIPAPLLKKRRKKGKRSPTRSSPTHKRELL